MPHIVLEQCLSDMAGDATTGIIFEFKEAVAALHNHEPLNQTEAEQIEALFETMEAWACTGGTYELGAAAQAADFTSQCNAFL